MRSPLLSRPVAAATVAAGALVLAACGGHLGAATPRPAGASAGTGRPPLHLDHFVPAVIGRIGDSTRVVVSGTTDCGRELCPTLLVGTPAAGAAWSFTRVAAPPEPRPRLPGGGVGQVVFTDRADGFYLRPQGADGPAEVTTDGGRSWHQLRFGDHSSVFEVAGSAQLLASVVATCSEGARSEVCGHYRLERSAPGSRSWTTTTIPDTKSLNGEPLGLAVSGRRVWVNVQPLASGSRPVTLSSVGDGRLHVVSSQLMGGSGCSLRAASTTVVWATCIGGMLVDYFRSSDAGRRFAGYWSYPGTGGGGVDPVGANLAFRWTGVPSPGVPGDRLQVTSDGGRRWSPVGRLPTFSGAQMLRFVDARRGLLLGTRSLDGPVVILSTDGGGRHWTPIRF